MTILTRQLDVDAVPEEMTEEVSRILMEASETFAPFTHDTDFPGYGARVRFRPGDECPTGPDMGELRMDSFCWCERSNCPLCIPRLRVEEGLSAHEVIEFRDDWLAAQHVHDEGAPNFYLRDAQGEIFIWWYKSIGRGMTLATTGETTFSPEDLERRIRALGRGQEGTILRADARIALASIAPDDLDCLSVFLDGLAGDACSDHARLRAGIERLLTRLDEWRDLSWQMASISDSLDATGAPRCPNPEDPEEMQMIYTTAHRVKIGLGQET